MKWHIINQEVNTTTRAMEVGTGVLVRVNDWEDLNLSESMCFVPDCRIMEGGCSERARVVRRTHNSGGPR